LIQNLDAAELGLQPEQDGPTEGALADGDGGESDADVELVSELDLPVPDQLQQSTLLFPGMNPSAGVLVISVEESTLLMGGLSLQDAEAQRQQDLQTTLPGVEPPPGSPSDLSTAGLQQLLEAATQAVRGGSGAQQP
jgi:hypothetical protein